MITPRISLKIIVAPATGHILDAPPVLMASDHSVDYICGRCSTVLLHAEENQVRGVLIRLRVIQFNGHVGRTAATQFCTDCCCQWAQPPTSGLNFPRTNKPRRRSP
jgi:hypothetical protein